MEGTITNKALAKRFENSTLGAILFNNGKSVKERVSSEYRAKSPRWFQRQQSKRIAQGFKDISKD